MGQFRAGFYFWGHPTHALGFATFEAPEPVVLRWYFFDPNFGVYEYTVPAERSVHLMTFLKQYGLGDDDISWEVYEVK
jgi:hypothetical protein